MLFLCLYFCRGKLGALRLKVRLVEDRILPSMYYQPLIDLLVESVISPAEVSIWARPPYGFFKCSPSSCPETSRFHHTSSIWTHTRSWHVTSVVLSTGGGQQCPDHAGGGDHSGEQAGCCNDSGEDLPRTRPGGAFPWLPKHPGGQPHQ